MSDRLIETADSGSTMILKADDCRRRAMLQGDVITLADLLADDLVHIHSNGRADDKAAYLAMISRWPNAYRRVDRVEASVQINGVSGWMTGIQSLHIERDGRRTESDMRFLSVWSFQDGVWRMAAFSAIRIA
jgi:ketosteroid isomerase-like protein